MNNNKQYYFIYNGKRIETGTILKIKPWRNSMGECFVEEIVFEWYVPEIDLYVFRYTSNYGTKGSGMYGYIFKEYLICPTSKMDVYVVRDHNMLMENNNLTFVKELQVDGMAIAWLWYVVLMAVTLIFNGFIVYWVLINLCFFIYRYGKLKEEGYK